MRVEDENARLEMPEECDYCGYKTQNLDRFTFYGPGYNVEWLCNYCRHDHTQGNNEIVKSIAAMLNQLEKRIKI